jgi:hypothetical protein
MDICLSMNSKSQTIVLEKKVPRMPFLVANKHYFLRYYFLYFYRINKVQYPLEVQR